MPDPIRKRFGYGHLWPLRPEGRQNRARSYNYAGSDIPHPIQFRSTKEDLDHFVQNRPGSDLDGLVSGFGQTHLVHKQAGVKEPRGPFLAERSRPATSFPLSDSVAFFHRRPGSDCAKQGRVRFGSG